MGALLAIHLFRMEWTFGSKLTVIWVTGWPVVLSCGGMEASARVA